MSDGTTVAVTPAYSATGGSISASGVYTAGNTAGSYRVIATDTSSNRADTAAITITAAPVTLAKIVLTPASATVAAGASKTFTVTDTMSDGSTKAFAGQCTATGGSVSAPCTYVAGSTAGSYRIIAAEGSRADTASITVTTSTPPATAEGCPSSGYLRLVNVSTVSQLFSAVSAATAGDQIRLAAGTYTLGSDLVLSRSGTAQNPITLCGPRTAVLTSRPIQPKADHLVLKGFRHNGMGTALWNIYSDPGSFNVYDSLELDHSYQESFHLHGSSKHNELKHLYIHDTGDGRPSNGEGIYMGSGATNADRADSNWAHHNTLTNITQECFDIKEGTTGNLLEYNTMSYCGTYGSVGGDAGIALRGDSTMARYNTIRSTPRYAMQIWPDCSSGCVTYGKGNVMSANTMSGMGNDTGIQVRSGFSANKVYCDNVVPSGSTLVSGLSCQP
jgi:hypothetical protein